MPLIPEECPTPCTQIKALARKIYREIPHAINTHVEEVIPERAPHKRGLSVTLWRCIDYEFLDPWGDVQEAKCHEKQEYLIHADWRKCYQECLDTLRKMKAHVKTKPTVAFDKTICHITCAKEETPTGRIINLATSKSIISAHTGLPSESVKKLITELKKAGIVYADPRKIMGEDAVYMKPEVRKAFLELLKEEKIERMWEGYRKLFKELPEKT